MFFDLVVYGSSVDHPLLEIEDKGFTKCGVTVSFDNANNMYINLAFPTFSGG